jgi:quercetin dioxygenase-like cupin family protein
MSGDARTRPVPVAVDEASELLLDELAASAEPASPRLLSSALRGRLMRRAERGAQQEAVFHTVRGPAQWCIADGLRTRWLYQRDSLQRSRAGEPLRVRELQLAPGERARLHIAESALRSEWLVLSGDVRIDAVALTAYDHHARVTGPHAVALASEGGARVLLREALATSTEDGSCTARASAARWERLTPHIERRVLCQWGREAALLYRVQPGAGVPQHGHGHDEECLLLAGELFLDDLLLRDGDYQLAPAGTHHDGVSSDTGALVYAHGDIELAFTAA